MNKKSIIISILLILVVGSILFIFNMNKQFKIESKYYNNKGLTSIDIQKLNNLLDNKESFVLFTYNSYCTFKVSCDGIFNNVAKEKGIEILQIPFDEFRKTKLYDTVKYAPSVIIIKNGRIKSFLDANSDDDYNKYQNEKEFSLWLDKYLVK